MKVTVFLRNEHELLKALFDKFKKPSSRTQSNGRKELFNEIQREILIHSQIESEIFYPALAGTSSARAHELVSTAVREHNSVEKVLQELNGMNIADKNFDAKMDQLIDDVDQHIAMEEEEIFDEARKNLPEFRLEELGLEMEDRRKILTTLAA
jgi:iron-sulfur cluster repair protein YtfE (RIC family)